MTTDVIYAHAPIKDTPAHMHAYSARVHLHTRIPFCSEQGTRWQGALGALRCAPTEDHSQSEDRELKKGGYCIEISEVSSV